MRRIPVMLIVFALAASALSQERDADLLRRARAGRSLREGQKLIEWDQTLAEGGWKRWSATEAQRPGFGVDPRLGSKGVPALMLSGSGKRNVFGGWKYTVGFVEPGKYFRLYAVADIKGVPNIRRNVLLRVRWTGESLDADVMPDNVTSFTRGDGYSVTFDQKFVAPKGAEGAVVELLVQWAENAYVAFKEVSFEAGGPAAPRYVKAAAVFWNGEGADGTSANFEAIAPLIDEAAGMKPDVIVLPETFTSVGGDYAPRQIAERLPGDVFMKMGARAREHKCYIIYGTYEIDDTGVYNTAVVINRDGTLAGRYRKVQVSPSEAEAGVAAGDFFRTIDFDFGRAGILISRDSAFAESARVNLLDGADLIFVLMRGESRRQLEARACDNGLWLVASGTETPSLVIDPTGKVTSIAFNEIGTVAFGRFNLEERVPRKGLGDWKSQLINERRTDAYLKLVQE